MIGHRQMMDPWQVKSSTGLNRDAWPLRVNANRELDPALKLRSEPASRLRRSGFDRG